jgi:hypothetical protein
MSFFIIPKTTYWNNWSRFLTVEMISLTLILYNYLYNLNIILKHFTKL